MKYIYILFSIFILVSLELLANSNDSIFIRLNYFDDKNSLITANLKIGVHKDATDGYDYPLEVDMPPPPFPMPTFEIFDVEMGETFFTEVDYRPFKTDSLIFSHNYKFIIQGYTRLTYTLRWNITDKRIVKARMYDNFDGLVHDVDMLAQNELVVPGPPGHRVMNFYVEYDPTFSNVEVNEVANVQLYPNPASDFLNVLADGTCSIEIFDVLGQQVLVRDILAPNSIDIGDFDSGVYFYFLIMPDKAILKGKFVKQ